MDSKSMPVFIWYRLVHPKNWSPSPIIMNCLHKKGKLFKVLKLNWLGIQINKTRKTNFKQLLK